jgi:hypothetical protein
VAFGESVNFLFVELRWPSQPAASWFNVLFFDFSISVFYPPIGQLDHILLEHPLEKVSTLDVIVLKSLMDIEQIVHGIHHQIA